jgi:hypothetical protein
MHKSYVIATMGSAAFKRHPRLGAICLRSRLSSQEASVSIPVPGSPESTYLRWLTRELVPNIELDRLTEAANVCRSCACPQVKVTGRQATSRWRCCLPGIFGPLIWSGRRIDGTRRWSTAGKESTVLGRSDHSCWERGLQATLPVVAPIAALAILLAINVLT